MPNYSSGSTHATVKWNVALGSSSYLGRAGTAKTIAEALQISVDEASQMVLRTTRKGLQKYAPEVLERISDYILEFVRYHYMVPTTQSSDSPFIGIQTGSFLLSLFNRIEIEMPAGSKTAAFMHANISMDYNTAAVQMEHAHMAYLYMMEYAKRRRVKKKKHNNKTVGQYGTPLFERLQRSIDQGVPSGLNVVQERWAADCVMQAILNALSSLSVARLSQLRRRAAGAYDHIMQETEKLRIAVANKINSAAQNRVEAMEASRATA